MNEHFFAGLIKSGGIEAFFRDMVYNPKPKEDTRSWIHQEADRGRKSHFDSKFGKSEVKQGSSK